MNEHTSREVPRTVGRRRKRRLVTVVYFLLTLVALVFAFAESELMYLIALALLTVAFAFYAVQLYPIVQGLTQQKASRLDERELGVHGRAYFKAYRVLGVICGVTLAYMTLAATPWEVQMHWGTHLAMPTQSQFSFLGLLYGHLLISLPAAMVAWTEPDPPDPDED